MNRIIIVVILLAVIFIVFNKKTENFWSRPSKCFDCEKQITSIYDAHLAFPSKCFDCEKQSKIPYFEGPTKCFDCDNQLKQSLKIKQDSCAPIDDSRKYKFQTYMRNRFPNRS
jgi:hypothetical protein